MNAAFAVLAIIGATSFILAIVVAVSSRHKKSGTRDLLVIGVAGFVNTKLDPEGWVLIHGALWRARSKHGAVVDPTKKVIVVGVQGHLLLAEPMSDKL